MSGPINAKNESTSRCPNPIADDDDDDDGNASCWQYINAATNTFGPALVAQQPSNAGREADISMFPLLLAGAYELSFARASAHEDDEEAAMTSVICVRLPSRGER